jgi:hypothetical protein
MIHFLWSIFFLFCTIALALVYVAGTAATVSVTFFAIKLVKELHLTRSLGDAWMNAKAWIQVWLCKVMRPRPILFFLLFLCSMNIFFYCKQRIEWMGADNGNLAAKEYWVAGQVVYGYRALFCLFQHPDKPFIQPYSRLQEWIYQKGVRYLPENDGEIGVWTDIWFVYPYSKNLLITIGASGYEPSPKMIALVERSWFALEKEATGNWADYQMKTQHYFRNFPGQAFYYVTYKGYLTGKKVGSHTSFTQDQHLQERDRMLVGWLAALPEQWQTAEETALFIKRNQKIEALRQVTVIIETGDLVYGSIFKKTFSCDSQEIRSYLALREALVANKDTVLLRMADKAQARTLYDLVVNIEVARYLHYSLKRFCGLDAAGKEDMTKYGALPDNPTPDQLNRDRFRGARYKEACTECRTPEQWREERLLGLFPEETGLLKEMFHGR